MTTTDRYPGAASARPAPDLAEAMRRTRRVMMVAGVLAIVLGIVAIVVPAIASVATAIFIGWIFVIASGFQLVDAFSIRDRKRMAVRLLLAVLSFAAGVYLLVSPLDGAFTLTVMLVIWFVATGTARIVFGISELGAPGAGLTALSGVLTLALGLLIALKLPSSADWAIGLVVGVDLLFSGTILVMIARRLPAVAP